MPTLICVGSRIPERYIFVPWGVQAPVGRSQNYFVRSALIQLH